MRSSLQLHVKILGVLILLLFPPIAPVSDGFTYVVSDGKGGVTASFVTVIAP